MHIRVLGMNARVDAPEELRHRLERDWSRCVRNPSPDESELGFRIDRVEGVDPERQYFILTSEITSRAVGELSGGYLAFHACGLSDQHGRVVALIGAPAAGKSTAALALARSSFGYVSDEVVAVSAEGEVLPFPRPVAVQCEDALRVDKTQRGPDELRLLSCHENLTLERLVLLSRQPDHQAAPGLESVPPLAALLELVPQTSALTTLDHPLQRLCRLIDRAGGVFRLGYVEIADTERILHALLESPERRTMDWSTVDLRPTAAQAAGRRDPGRIRRAAIADAVQIGEDLLLLVGQDVVQLSGLGRTIWEAAGNSPEPDELMASVVAAHGPHRDSRALVNEAIESMRSGHILAR